MQGRQVLVVFVALVAIAIAGLVVRFVSADPDELALEGLLPIVPEIIDQVTLDGAGQQTTIRRVGEEWLLRSEPAFETRLAVFWGAVNLVSGAQLIARNPANHSLLGVDDTQGIRIGFYLGDSLQEELIFSPVWSEDVQLCYLRKPQRDEVYGVPCPFPQIFDASPDSWRNPIVAELPGDALESMTFDYPDDNFILRRETTGWVVQAEGQEFPANPLQIDTLISLVDFILAKGFATEQEAAALNFDSPDATMTATTVTESGLGGISLSFLRRGDGDYYVKRLLGDVVYIVDGPTVDTLLRPRAGYIFAFTGGG